MKTLQEKIDAMAEMEARTRSRYHLTLQGLIDALQSAPEGATIGLEKPHSYRGYYKDLAFEPCEQRPVADVLAEAVDCLGKTFTGYKGGQFTMTENTPLWVAEWGRSSQNALLGVEFDDTGKAKLHIRNLW